METEHKCDSCKFLEEVGLEEDLAYQIDGPPDDNNDKKDVERPDDDDFDDKVSDDEAKLIRGDWPSEESGSDEKETNCEEYDDEIEEPENGGPLKRVKRAYVKMPTEKRYFIPSPKPRNWSCRSGTSKLITLKPYGRTRDEYRIIKKEMEKTIVSHPGYSFKSYDIISIEKIVNGCLWKQYLHRQKEIKAECGFVNQRMLWHGSKSIDDIAAHGFNEQYANLQGMFGAGIYFARHSSKSNQYVFNTARASQCPVHNDMNCKLCERKQLLCRVSLGKTKLVYTMERFYHAPQGFDSVTALPSTQQKGLKYPEYIIYRREQAYPEYLITYKLA